MARSQRKSGYPSKLSPPHARRDSGLEILDADRLELAEAPTRASDKLRTRENRSPSSSGDEKDSAYASGAGETESSNEEESDESEESEDESDDEDDSEEEISLDGIEFGFDDEDEMQETPLDDGIEFAQDSEDECIEHTRPNPTPACPRTAAASSGDRKNRTATSTSARCLERYRTSEDSPAADHFLACLERLAIEAMNNQSSFDRVLGMPQQTWISAKILEEGNRLRISWSTTLAAQPTDTKSSSNLHQIEEAPQSLQAAMVCLMRDAIEFSPAEEDEENQWAAFPLRNDVKCYVLAGEGRASVTIDYHDISKEKQESHMQKMRDYEERMKGYAADMEMLPVGKLERYTPPSAAESPGRQYVERLKSLRCGQVEGPANSSLGSLRDG